MFLVDGSGSIGSAVFRNEVGKKMGLALTTYTKKLI